MGHCICKQEQNSNLIGIFALIILLVAVIGALLQSPPERLNQSFSFDSSKVQHIVIGGTSSTKVSTN